MNKESPAVHPILGIVVTISAITGFATGFTASGKA